VFRLLRFLTIVQWQHIDRDFKGTQVHYQIDAKIIMVFLLFTFVLIGLAFFGMEPAFRFLFGERFRTWRYPGLYSYLYWASCRVAGYLILPVLVVKFVFRDPVQEYGVRIDRNPRIFLLYFLMLSAVLPGVLWASGAPGFLRTYPFYDQAANSWTELLLWESAYAMQFVALEFFFRGFVLFSFARHIGAYAIFLMSVPYTMIHFQKPLPETIGAVIAGVALGTLALRTRSILGGVLIHIAVAWSMDLAALWQKGLLQRLINQD